MSSYCAVGLWEEEQEDSFFQRNAVLTVISPNHEKAGITPDADQGGRMLIAGYGLPLPALRELDPGGRDCQLRSRVEDLIRVKAWVGERPEEEGR